MFRHFCWFVVLICPAAVMSQDCGALGNPANGQVVAPGTTVGLTATYTCNTGYNLVGVATRTCQADDTWSGAEPTCNIADCLATADPLDGSVSYNPNTLYQGYAEYSCDTGYTLSGNVQRQCQADGTWALTAPTCIINDCGTLSTPTDGSLTLTGTTYLSVAVFACNVGYDLTGSASRTCQANTLWDGSITLCVIKDCGTPAAPGNGSVDYSSGTKYLNTATFMCNSGYNLVGVSTRICQDDGTWETPFPTCDIKDCGPLTAAANTQIDTSGGTTFGSEAVYTCDPGYEISTAQDKRTCESSGQWSTTVPVCSRVDCGTVLAPVDGDVDLSGGILYQATALFTCNTGYDLTGDTSTTCQTDGTWSNPNPTCVIKDCGTPTAPTNGGVSLPNGTTYLSVAMFTCDMGYTMSGVADRQCLSTGSWEATFPTCNINDCGPLTPLSNTQVDTSGGTTYQSVANYTCDTGYELATGTDTRTCQSDSTWSTPEPYCTEKNCGALASLTNGVVNFPGTLYQDVATYSCNAGYTLIGVNTQTCQDTGTWDGTPPTCEINDCGPLTSPTNGAVDTTSGTTYLQLAEYTCDIGYTLVGVTTRTCDSSGTWTATEPTCQIIDCGSLSSPANGVVTATVTTYGQTATYQCVVGYNLVGVSSRTCMSTGFWSGSTPVCQIKDCGQPQTLSNAQFTVLTTTYESTANYTCDSNYGLVGSATVSCLSTGAWGTLPQCVADCGVPASITDGTVTYSMGTLEDAVATYSCNGGYTINGGATVTCGSEGSWSSAPTCSLNLGGYNSVCFTTLQCQTDRASCLDDGSGTTRCLCNSVGQIYDSDLDSCLTDCGTLTNPTNGVVVLPSITAEGQIATYSCDAGFALSGNATRVCLATGVYSDTEPSCLTGCTLPTPPENGNVSDPQGLVAGAAITYACYSGYVLVGDTSRICLTDSTFSGVAPVCKRECPVLSGVKSGTVDLSKGNYEGALATYICDKNYALKGQATRKCLSTGSWSGTEPTCIFSVFPDLVLILGLILTFLVVVDLILLTVFLYQKFIKKRIQQKKDGAEEDKKKPAFLPFMLERPEKGNQPPPSYIQSPGKSTKFSNIMPEDDDDENQDIRQRRTFHPPPRKPLAPIKIERGDKPLMFTPREKKPSTGNFESTTFDLDKPHMKPNTVNVNAYIPPESVSTARIEKVNPRVTGVDIKNGYNSNESNQKHGISAPEDDQLSSDGFELPKRKPVVSPPSDDVNAYFLGRMNVPPGQVTLDEPQPQPDPDRALTDESRKYMKSMVNTYSPKY